MSAGNLETHNAEAAAAARENALLVFAFLEAWDEAEPPSLRVISVKTGFALATVHGYVRRLAGEGLLETKIHPWTCVHCDGTGRVLEGRYVLTGRKP